MSSIGEMCARGLALWVFIAGLSAVVALLIGFFCGWIGDNDGRCGDDPSPRRPPAAPHGLTGDG